MKKKQHPLDRRKSALLTIRIKRVHITNNTQRPFDKTTLHIYFSKQFIRTQSFGNSNYPIRNNLNASPELQNIDNPNISP